MSLKFTHKPDYFLYTSYLFDILKTILQKHPEETLNFNLQDIYDLFGKDFASASTNLEGILNIADEYRVNFAWRPKTDSELQHRWKVQ